MTKPPYLLETDPADETPPLTYPQEAETVRRVGTRDYELDEIERLTTENGWFRYDNKGLRFSIRCLEDVIKEKDNQLATFKLELQAAFTSAALAIENAAPSGGFVSLSVMRGILAEMAGRLNIAIEESK